MRANPSRSKTSASSWALALLLWALPAAAESNTDSEFRAHYQRAQQLYQQRDYAGAERALLAAYALKPLPALLLNLGHARLDQGRPREALADYERYLRDEPVLTAAQRADVARYQQQARELIAKEEARPAPRERRRLGPLALGLALPGAALLIAGAATGGAALAASREVVSGDGPFDSALDQRGRALSQAALVLDILGGAALLGGAVCGALWWRQRAAAPVRVALVPSGRGALLLGSF